MAKKFSPTQLLKEYAPYFNTPEMKSLGELLIFSELEGYWKKKLVESGFFKDRLEAEHYSLAATSLQISPDLSHFDEEARKEWDSWNLDKNKLGKVLDLKNALDELDLPDGSLDEQFEAIKKFYEKHLDVEPGEMEFNLKNIISGLNERYIESASKDAREQGLDLSEPSGKDFLAKEWGVVSPKRKQPPGEIIEFNSKNRK